MSKAAAGILADIPTLLSGMPLGEIAGPDMALLIAFTVGLLVSHVRALRPSLSVGRFSDGGAYWLDR